MAFIDLMFSIFVVVLFFTVLPYGRRLSGKMLNQVVKAFTPDKPKDSKEDKDG
jgi:hypothetical protein